MAYIVALVNTKGGVGKSTTAINLAEACRRDGDSVLLIDSDFKRGTARRWHSLAKARGGEFVPVVTVDSDLLRQTRQFGDSYDVIIVDAPAYLDQVITSLVTLADLVLMPVQPSAPDLWACGDVMRWIEDRQMITGGTPEARFLLSRCHADERVNREEIDEVIATGVPVFTARTVHRVAYSRALKHGYTVFDLPESDKARSEFSAIHEEFNHVRRQSHR